ncbi:polyketide synthase, partial [Streptomyces microflavus]|uniref:CurL C-terminal domain-containing protein n=2 Tax=Actinomycetes TaxID=1760 RepID=UPI0034727773
APAPAPADGDEAQLLVLSAPDPDALAALATGYARFLEPGGAGRELPLRDVCFSAATRRDHHEHRLTAVGTSPDELVERLRAYAAGESRP